jgi:UDP-N-acetylmuramate dehydrogenase
MFKNPVSGPKAWQLIEQAGFRGAQYGGAKISDKHCNFLINTGNATALDIETLGEQIRCKVHESTHISLEWEIKILGNHA